MRNAGFLFSRLASTCVSMHYLFLCRILLFEAESKVLLHILQEYIDYYIII
jgi:hypothetical protein